MIMHKINDKGDFIEYIGAYDDAVYPHGITGTPIFTVPKQCWKQLEFVLRYAKPGPNRCAGLGDGSLPPPAVLAKEIAAAPPVPVKNEGPQNDAERDAVKAVVKLGVTKTEALNLLARAKSQGPAGDSSELTRRMFRMRGR